MVRQSEMVLLLKNVMLFDSNVATGRNQPLNNASFPMTKCNGSRLKMVKLAFDAVSGSERLQLK